ncbi:helix-turn-helix transcriptional regulator [Escherichia coli]|uniref:helix-turn-helix transcriptional regulator n=1 Tax=Escherichia coli TaxID=562 RepID=UPI001917E94B|nr:helix-turn-helix transcriptional regulator [Escherichia coli]
MIKLIHRMTAEKILEYVDAKVESGRRIDIESLAAYSGYNRRHLQRLFLAETGVRLGKYIRCRRLNRAALLLRFSRRRYQDIALSVGFDSQQSFNREFKRVTGMTPKAYREKPEWVLLPLSGSKRKKYTIPPPTVVWLSGGAVVGEEVVFYGTVDNQPDNPGIDAYLERIFGTEAKCQEELWMVVHTSPVEHEQYHYRSVCGIGHPEARKGRVFTYCAGKYLKVEFETTRETHLERTHHLYLNILPERVDVIRAGQEIMVLRHEKDKVMCTLYIPVPGERKG